MCLSDLVTSSSLLPFTEHLVEKAIDCLLEVEVSVHVEVPHFAAHLNEEVDHGRSGPEHNLGVLCDDPAGDSVPAAPHLTHVTPHQLLPGSDHVKIYWLTSPLYFTLQKLIFFFRKTTESIRDFFSLHISLRPRYCSCMRGSVQRMSSYSHTYLEQQLHAVQGNLFLVDLVDYDSLVV